MQLDPEHLRTFLGVIEAGSFSEAGARLGISQPAVSQQIKELERRVQLRLFERVGKKIRTTSAGVALIPHATRVLVALADARAEMEGLSAHPGGQIRIGAGATACIHLLPPILKVLKARHPTIDIVVSTGNTPEIARKVEDNALDAALVTAPVGGRALFCTPVMEDGFVALAPRSLVGPRSTISPGVLAALPLVSFEQGANTRSLTDRWFRSASQTPHIVMEMGSVEAMKEMVAAGLGCAVLPGLAVRNESPRADVVALRLEPTLTRTLTWIVRKDKPLSRSLQYVQEAVLKLRG